MNIKSNIQNDIKKYENIIINIVIMLSICFLVKLIGTRNINIGSDYNSYINTYYDSSYIGKSYELGYDTLQKIFLSLNIKHEYFFSFIAALEIIIYIIISKVYLKVCKIKSNLYIINYISILLILPFFWGGILNIIRQGISIAFLILGAFLLRFNNKILQSIIFFTLSVLFHYSSAIYILLLILLNNRETTVKIIFTILSVLYLLKLTKIFTLSIVNKLNISYILSIIEYGSSQKYKSGYRYDFYLFSVIPLILYSRFAKSKISKILINIYTIFLIPFLLFGYSSFIDRWLYPAWMMLPIIIMPLIIAVIKNKYNYYAINTVFVIISIIQLISIFRTN